MTASAALVPPCRRPHRSAGNHVNLEGTQLHAEFDVPFAVADRVIGHARHECAADSADDAGTGRLVVPLERILIVVERAPIKADAFHAWILRGTVEPGPLARVDAGLAEARSISRVGDQAVL